MKTINDTIYSHIELSNLEEYAIKTKIFSRLQFITQNALAYFAFPSINTKRYIHSLGTMHLCSHMFKSSLLHADDKTKERFFKNLSQALKHLCKIKKIKIKKDSFLYQDNTLYQFSIPLKDEQDLYFIVLQALRIAALLHDVGHLPFSHQVEFALHNLYLEQKDLKNLNKTHKSFIKKYEKITQNSKKVLHEAIGFEFIKILFEYELNEEFDNKRDKKDLAIVYEIVKAIFEDKKVLNFDFKDLHQFIDATIDADRLDYINRDMLSSGYIGGAVDLLRVAKQAVLVSKKDGFYNAFLDEAILDIEHTLEMRFNLYKKVIFNHELSKKDAMLENLIIFLSKRYFDKNRNEKIGSISMLWEVASLKRSEKLLDIITLLDENWLLSLFKEEYFKLKYSKNKSQKMLYIYEEVLFGKHRFYSQWKNLNDLYGVLDFDTKQRYRFRESFGYLTLNKLNILKKSLNNFTNEYEKQNKNSFLVYHIVSFNLGIAKDFSLYNKEHLISIDEVSTLRKRLKQSMLNTVPFFIYSNKKTLPNKSKIELRQLFIDVFEKNRVYKAYC